MNWQPKYTITQRLLSAIKGIAGAITEINHFPLQRQTLVNLETQARELSTYASTSIEGNPLPLTDVRRILKSDKAFVRDAEREVVNYNQALEAVYQSVRAGQFELSIATLENTQRTVVNGLMDNPAHCGAIRQEPVVIGNPVDRSQIVFIAPDAKDVARLLEELITFVNHNLTKIDPVILAGLFHRQHVIIHPFMDGNGRTTRLMTTAILGQAGLNLYEIFSFENYYNQQVSRYFNKVGLHGDYYELAESIDSTEWLEYFAEGILDELDRVRKHLYNIEKTSVRLAPQHKQILEYLRESGSISQREYGAISSRSLASRKLDFDKLLELGLIEARGRGRARYYVLTDH